MLLVGHIAVASVFGQNTAEVDFRLDLVPFRDLPRVDRQVIPRPAVTHGDEERSAIAVRLMPLGRDVFVWGEEFEYEVLVENVGRRPVILPWSADWLIPQETKPEQPTVRRASVAIEVRSLDNQQRLAQLNPQGLAGSVNMPGTIQRLGPKEKAIIRVPASWLAIDVNAAARVLAQPQNQVRMSVVVSLLDEQSVTMSSNSIATTVVRSR
jgi:hypothetical protein